MKQKIDINKLREDYEKSCNAYVEVLNDMWNINDGYWVGVGEVYCFLDMECLEMHEIIQCVENNVDIKTYFEWSEYNRFAQEFNQTHIALRAWLMGYHGMPKDDIDKLQRLKSEFEDSVKRYKSMY